MNGQRLLAVTLLNISGACDAGPLYGTVRAPGLQLTSLTVHVACPSFGQPSEQVDANVDARGSFALRVQTNGRCQMQIRSGGQSGAPFSVFVSNNPLRYDFSIDGQLNRVQ